MGKGNVGIAARKDNVVSKMPRSLTHASLVMVLALLAACGGGGGGSSGSAPGGGGGAPGAGVTPSNDSYLAYGVKSTAGDLMAINAVNPDSPTPALNVDSDSVALASDGLEIFPMGIVDAANNLTGMYQRVMYNKAQEGGIYFADLRLGQLPTPRRISNENTAQVVCEMAGAGSNGTHLVYELPGVDGDCLDIGDNVWKMVRFDMTSSEAPVIALEPVTSITDSTGTTIGWLAYDGFGNLVRTDSNFGAQQPVAASVGYAEAPAETVGGKPVIEIDDTIRVFDPASNTLSPPYHTFDPLSFLRPFNDDGDYFFFADGANLYRLDLTNPAPAVQLTTETSNIGLPFLALTADRVIYHTSAGIRSIPKAGGPSITLVANPPNGAAIVKAISGNLVYYDLTVFDGSGTQVLSQDAGVIGADGSGGSVHPDALWAGITLAPAYSSGISPPALYVILSDYNVASQSQAGGTLRSYQAASHTLVGTLGTVPSDVNYLYLAGWFGSAGLAQGFNGSPPTATETDVFFFDAAKPNSLLRLTTSGVATLSKKPNDKSQPRRFSTLRSR